MDEYKDLDLDRLGHTAVSQGEEGMLRAWTSLHKKILPPPLSAY